MSIIFEIKEARRKGNPSAAIGLAKSFLGEGNISKLSISALGEFLVEVGQCYEMVDRNEDAEYCFRQAIAQSPNSEAAYSSLGHLYIKTGKLDDAENSFKTGIRHFYASPQLLEDQILLDKRRGKLGLAIQRCSQAMTSYPADKNFIGIMAELNALAGNYERTRIILDGNPSLRDSPVQASRAKVALKEARYKDASDEALALIESDPQNAIGYALLGASALHQSDVAEKIRLMEESLHGLMYVCPPTLKSLACAEILLCGLSKHCGLSKNSATYLKHKAALDKEIHSRLEDGFLTQSGVKIIDSFKSLDSIALIKEKLFMLFRSNDLQGVESAKATELPKELWREKMNKVFVAGEISR